MKTKPSLIGRALVPLLAAMVLAGCAAGPEARQPEPLAVPGAFKETGEIKAAQLSPPAHTLNAWWAVFSDPVLNSLMDKATQRNTSIQVAAGRLAQARAIARSTDADRAVNVGLGAGATRQTVATNGNQPATVVSAGASLSYEIDLFGKLSGASNAALLDASARESLLHSTQLLIQADVAQTYLSLRAIDEERALVQRSLAAFRNTLRLTEIRFREGDVAELDVARVRTETAATESEALALEQRRALAEHALAVLVGNVASSFALAPADGWTTALPTIPPGIPSTVLVRRPDISAAQDSLLAAQARVGVAKTAWFPSLALTATGGYAAPELGDLFRMSARSWGIGALLSLPVFDGGRREAGVQNANAEMDIALAQYREQVLIAFRDVEDQLVALRLLADQAEAQSRSVASATRATALSDSRYRNGFVSQLELLDAQRSELRNKRQALQVKTAQYLATVGLIRALGGGWV